MKEKRRRRTTKLTFSKKAVKWLMWIAVIDLQFSYILALLGREQIAETLSITICTEIIAVMLGYFLKAYFETKSEKQLEWEKEQHEKESEVKDEFFG